LQAPVTVAIYLVVTVGETFIVDVVAPVLQWYVTCPPAPVTVSVVVVVGQIVSFEALAEAVIKGVSLTVTSAESEQVIDPWAYKV
jgi:hypothetical protein